MHSIFSLMRRAAVWALWVAALGLAHAQATENPLQPGRVVLVRHALAPGVGDPERFSLNDCTTQRNLSAEGQAQAVRIGAFIRKQGVPVDAVWSSQWCRTRDTADLAFPGRRVDQPAFNSFFGEPDAAPAQTQDARALLNRWTGQGLLVVITHQVNITALTGVVPASGEAVVLSREAGGWRMAGRFTP